ncbi:MAG: DUF2793 domain-containing protein [Nitratireductor sp.]|nr:DUF2793 domain-containing protein [Nitratireductor sp.]
MPVDQSENLSLPYIAPQQAQKHVTHNEAIRMLDAVVQLSVASDTQTAPPATPDPGERHIIAAGATGAWAGHDLEIAAYQDGAWAYYPPQAGWLAWVEDIAGLQLWDGSQWIAAGAQESLPLFGVNTVPDATNRLAVKSDAVLLSHDDVTPGSGDMQLKVNKAASGGTGSVLFQTGFSGRAEFGLAGNDDFSIKVSPDGATFRQAIVVDRNTGHVGIGATPSANLEVRDDNAASEMRFKTAGDYNAIFAGDSNRTLQGAGNLIIVGRWNGNTVTAIRLECGPDTANKDDGQIAFRTASGGSMAERMLITHDGKVGIGTGSPGALLDVNGAVRVKSYTVAGLPSASGEGAGAMIFVSDETGGAVLSFSDGTDWRRVTDRAVVS